MFCKHCGQPIEDTAKFCASCGTAIDHPVLEAAVSAVNSGASTASALAETEIPLPTEPPTAPPQPYSTVDPPRPWAAPVEPLVTPPVKKKRTGVVFLCIGLVLVILAAVLGGIWTWEKVSSPHLGNTPANLYCGGLVAEHNGTVYFSYASGTYKQTKDGTQKIYDTPLVYLNVASDGTLYGVTTMTNPLVVVHIDSNGHFLETVYTFEDINRSRYIFLALYNQDLFIQSDTSLLKLHIPSNEQTTLETHIKENGIASISIDETGLYYAKESGSSTQCYHMPFNEDKPVKCSHNASMYFCSGWDFYPPVANGKVYFFDDRALEIKTIDTTTDAANTFHLNTVGKEVSGTTEDIPLWTCENEMYCIMNLTDDSGEALCRVTVSKDGTSSVQVLVTGDYYGCRINIAGDQVYCISGDDDNEDPIRVYDTQTGSITSIRF